MRGRRPGGSADFAWRQSFCFPVPRPLHLPDDFPSLPEEDGEIRAVTQAACAAVPMRCVMDGGLYDNLGLARRGDHDRSRCGLGRHPAGDRAPIWVTRTGPPAPHGE